MSDWIRIDRLALDCIVGTRPHERISQQRVGVDVALQANLAAAGRSGKISLTVDYDRVAHEVVELLRFRHYHLIEMAAEEVCAMLLGLHPLVRAADLRIEKPGALEGRARAASVQVVRHRHEFRARVQMGRHGRTETLLETRDALLERIVVEPGRTLEESVHFEASGIQWLDAGELEGPGGALDPDLPTGATTCLSARPSCWSNRGSQPAVLFRCWRRSS